jgi:hypothetical protein
MERRGRSERVEEEEMEARGWRRRRRWKRERALHAHTGL